MFGMIALVVTGFVAGVVLTTIVACYVVGLIHAEAVRVVDDHFLVFASVAPPSGPSAGRAR